MTDKLSSYGLFKINKNLDFKTSASNELFYDLSRVFKHDMSIEMDDPKRPNGKEELESLIPDHAALTTLVWSEAWKNGYYHRWWEPTAHQLQTIYHPLGDGPEDTVGL